VKILIADDEPMSRRLLEKTLEREGYEVIAVDNGRLALQQLSLPDGPRLALLDWMMPELDGPGVCLRIRKQHERPYIHIVLLTSRSSKQDVVTGLEAGADDYMTKPWDPAELTARLRVGQRILQLEDRLTGRKQTEEALRRSELRVQRLVDSNIIGIAIGDLGGKLIDANAAFLGLLGYTREELLSGNMHWDNMTPPEYLDRDQRAVEQLRNTGVVAPWEKECFRKDGSRVSILIGVVTVLSAQGDAESVAFVLDISERKRLEQKLRHAQKLEAVGSLAAGMAHEINTPIQFVGDNARFLQDSFHGIADMIDRYEELCEEADKGAVLKELLERARAAREKADWVYLRRDVPNALEQMLDGVGRVATIVRAMKEFSHLNQSVEKTAADLNKALESTLVVARNELKYVAEVETNYGELPLVMCHLGDLNQVFLNLLVNAAHAIGDAVKGTGEKGRIGVRTKQDGEWVEIAISDTGTGVPERIRERIFDPFFTTKEVGKGSGQGLALARAIVMEKHEGTLTFETEVGKGTAFYVRLPVSGVREAKEMVAE
jgi:two-component system, NtrC family, sensor kinase